MSDLIDRKAVIKAIDKFIPADPMKNDYTQGISVGLAIATRCIEEFSQETDESSQGLVKDLINRQWLMECVNEGWIKFDTEKDENRFMHLVRDIAPSVQPEPLSDKEQRIFLAAMAREEKVCKQVDDDWRYMDSNVENLVRVCQEIKRKVKGALWT